MASAPPWAESAAAAGGGGTAVAIPAIASGVGGLLSFIGGKNAQNQQAEASKEAIGLQREVFENEKQRAAQQLAMNKQLYNAWQQRMAPYQAMNLGALAHFGVTQPGPQTVPVQQLPMDQPAPTPTMPSMYGGGNLGNLMGPR